MAKLKLNPEPTFRAKVAVPVPGAAAASVEFTFKWRTRDEVIAWIEAVQDKTDAEIIMDAAVAWELDDEFTVENAARLCNTYCGAGRSFMDAYLGELRGARSKN